LTLLSLVSFGISLRFAFAMPPLSGWDETAHAGYAIELARGNLPRIDTWVLDDHRRFPQLSDAIAGWNPRGRQIWVANHPPLYYLVVAPFMALADRLGVPGAGLLAMRVLNAAGTAGCVVVVGLIARELVGRRAVTLLAAVLVASAGTLAMQGGYGYNDGIAALVGGLALLAGVRLLRRGPTFRCLTVVALAAAAAAGLKAPNLVAVAACVAMAGAAVLVHRPGRHLAIRALGAGGLVAAVPALAFGWFYLRNLRLYGDLTGAEVLLTGFQRRARGSVLETALDPGFHRRWFEEIWIRPTYDPNLRVIPYVILAAAFLGLFLLGRDRLRAPAMEPPGSTLDARMPPARRGVLLAWWILGLHAVVLLALLVQFHSSGGYVHRRYLLSLLPVLATVLAVGLLRSSAALYPLEARSAPLVSSVPPAPRTPRREVRPDRERWYALVMLLLSTGMLLLPFMADGSTAVPVERLPKVSGLDHPTLGWPAPMLAYGMAATAALCFVVREARWVLLPANASGQPVAGAPGEPGNPKARRLAGDAPSDAELNTVDLSSPT
jgi:hypothetical protein